MKRLILVGILFAFTIPAFAKDERLERLSPEHRKWVEEEVAYIITESESDVFLELETVEERERFIEAFWRKRDPNPATPENEFKIEHYRRIEHANKFLGRETFRDGWRTDRGRYYIILGEPRETQRYDGYSDLVSAELWFYEGDTRKGLPSFFYLLFFKRHDIGEYELYHPVVDGPGSLLKGGQYTYSSDVQEALDRLQEISPELARASLSFDTSDPPDFMTGRASLGTDIMMARVEESPKRAIRADYADAYLRFGKKVSAEYSFNYIPSRSVFSVLVGPESTPFLNYSIEIDPQNFTIETDEDKTKFYTTLDVSVEATDLEGNTVVSSDKEVYLELSPSQVQQVGASPFSYQDDFPLLPGDYKVGVILRNRVIKQYTVAEQEIRVPPFTEGKPGLSDIVLGFRTEVKQGVQPGELRTFQVGDLQVHPASDHVFSIGDTVHVLLQAVGVGPEHTLRFALRNGTELVQEKSSRVEDYQGGPVIERFQLTNMVGGNYDLQVELRDPSGQVVAEKSTTVQVSPRSDISRPWIYRSSFNTKNAGLLALARGDQLWNMKRYTEAQAEYEKAVAANDEGLPLARWKLAGAYIRNGQGDQALALLVPMEEKFPQQFEVIAGLGFAYYLKNDFNKTVEYLERAMLLRPADTTLLNVLGDAHQKLGNLDQAKTAYERSLALDPNQEQVKKLVADIQPKS